MKLYFGFIIIISIFSLLEFNSSAAFSDKEFAFLEDTTYKIEKDLESENSSIQTELISLKEYYSELYDSTEDEQVNVLLDTVEDFLYLNSNTYTATDINLSLKLAVQACIAFFHHNQYKLSEELLIYAFQNTELDVKYRPIHFSILYHTKEYQEACKTREFEGKIEFFDKENVVEADAYYSIHGAKFYKENVHQNFVIIDDRYDYAWEEYEFAIEDAAVKTMFLAQLAGVITPFQMYISGSAPHMTKYYNRDGLTHTIDCSYSLCRLNVKESHHMNISEYNSNNHILTCTNCFYQSTEKHTFSVETYDTYSHNYVCRACNYQYQKSHVFELYKTFDDDYHMANCSECGADIKEEHIWTTYSKSIINLYVFNKKKMCSKCGLVKL